MKNIKDYESMAFAKTPYTVGVGKWVYAIERDTEAKVTAVIVWPCGLATDAAFANEAFIDFKELGSLKWPNDQLVAYGFNPNTNDGKKKYFSLEDIDNSALREGKDGFYRVLALTINLRDEAQRGAAYKLGVSQRAINEFLKAGYDAITAQKGGSSIKAVLGAPKRFESDDEEI